MQEMIELVSKYGFPLVVACFFLLKDTRKDKETDEKIEKLETFVRTELLNTLKDSIESNKASSEVIRERNIRSEKIEKALDENSRVISENSKVITEFKSFFINRTNN